jgi:hypothetical protein
MSDQTNHIAQIDAHDERWIAFVEFFPQANIFQHPEWVYILHECYKYQPFIIALLDDQGEILAGLPFMDVDSRLTGRRWVSLPFTDYCRPLFRDQNSLGRLTEQLIGLTQNKHNPRIEVRWDLPASSSIHRETQFVWHTINLDLGIESISRSLHRTQRQNIRTAEKNEIKIEWGKDLDHLRTFYGLHCLTRRRQGVPVQPWRFFELILQRLIDQGLGFILLAYHGDECLTAGLFLNWQTTLIYKFSASSDSGHDLRPNHLITWTAIRWGCENGYKVFDFGRTDITNDGLRTYKNRWGANEMPLTYSILSDNPPQLSSGGPEALMNRIIKNSPMWVCRLSGELLYRHFG